MVTQGHATMGDILLLFIYLELGAMVGIYFKTNVLPVRCLIYIAITALARLVIADVQAHHQAGKEMLWVAAAILLLALATRVIAKPQSEH
jgi:phosphate starvation-inducible membrane PsiE